MSLSGYKVEALLNDFRERNGYKRIAEHRIDSLEVSDEAQSEAYRLQSYLTRSKPAPQWVTPQNILELIMDRTEYEAIVEYEQQRRAGLFVEPNYIPPDPPPLMGLVRDYSEAIEKARKSVETLAETPTTEIEQPSSEPQKEETKQKKSPTPSRKEKGAVDLNLDLEDDAAIEDFTLEEDESQADDSNVVYGFGKITPAAMIEFIHSNPDSALKFMTQRELEGKLLSAEVADVHETWRQRGLSRKLIRDYILNIMEWEEWPTDKTLMDIWSELRDAIYDLRHQL